MFIFKPLIVIVEDALSHAFSEVMHVQTVHANYGNNHVEVELASTNSDNENRKNHNNDKSEEQVTAHFSQGEYAYDFSLNNFHQQNNSFPVFKLPFVFIPFQIPPPKFS